MSFTRRAPVACGEPVAVKPEVKATGRARGPREDTTPQGVTERGFRHVELPPEVSAYSGQPRTRPDRVQALGSEGTP